MCLLIAVKIMPTKNIRKIAKSDDGRIELEAGINFLFVGGWESTSKLEAYGVRDKMSTLSRYESVGKIWSPVICSTSRTPAI